MAAAVTGASLMVYHDIGATLPVALIRFAGRMLPEHRREWAEAALNEVAYIGSRRAALSWALGCMLFALKERSSYDFGRAIPTHLTLKTLVRVSAMLAIAVVGVYAIQKPYQRERISLTMFHGCQKSGCPPHSSRAVRDAWAINLRESRTHDPRASH